MKRLEYDKVTICPTSFDRDVETGELMIGHDKQIVKFQCPCGCGSTIDLYDKRYINRPNRNWTITVTDNKVTLWPSVNMTGHDCESHFWIRDNKVIWV